jgi:ribosomal protein S10
MPWKENVMNMELATLAEDVEAALILEHDLADRVLSVINGLSAELDIKCADLDSTDQVLALIYAARPGWSVSIKGTATLPNGHWRCTLRKSASRDNDEYLGIGRGPTLPHSLLAALIKALSFSA